MIILWTLFVISSAFAVSYYIKKKKEKKQLTEENDLSFLYKEDETVVYGEQKNRESGGEFE